MLGIFTDLDPSTHVVGRRNDRDTILRDIDAVLEALFRNVGEVLQDLRHDGATTQEDSSLAFQSALSRIAYRDLDFETSIRFKIDNLRH
jgi:hypothetical protein